MADVAKIGVTRGLRLDRSQTTPGKPLRGDNGSPK
jgi:hypothetical protein